MPVLVVNVVDVVAVLDRLVATALPMNVVMLLVDHVSGRRTFVPVPLVGPVSVAVVQVVRVISMGDLYVPTPGSVGMVVVCVGLMFWHETHLLRVLGFKLRLLAART
jgi:L-lactate permease